MKHEPGYETVIAVEFLAAHGTRRPDGVITHLNERRVTESHREVIGRWCRRDVVPLSKLDEFLHKYDLMLFELEHWATEVYGRDGWVDPYHDPKELVA